MNQEKRNYLSVIWQLTIAELFVMSKRRLMKAVIAVSVGAVIAFVLVRTGLVLVLDGAPLSDFVPPFCSDKYIIPGCVTHVPMRADLEAYKQLRIQQTVAHLSLPLSLNNISGSMIGSFLFMGLVIVVGVTVGDDYTQRTVRIMYTRGPTRLQFLWAKMIAISIYAIPSFILLNVLGLGLAQINYFLLGFSPDWSFFTIDWVWQAVLYLLGGMLIWFVNMQMAFFFGTSGRSTTSGIVATLVWWAVEFALFQIISAFTDPTKAFPFLGMKALSDYFIWSNLYSLHDNLAHTVYDSASGSLSNLHSLIILFVYIVVFVGLSCWITVKYDTTE